MREILFRGKRTDNKQWTEGFYALIGEINPNSYIVTSAGYRIRVAHKSISQYTGLTDKNGKKIFEGDIVEYREEYGCISYHNEEGMFCVEFDTWLTDFDHIYGREVEVVGNIYDNPNF